MVTPQSYWRNMQLRCQSPPEAVHHVSSSCWNDPGTVDTSCLVSVPLAAWPAQQNDYRHEDSGTTDSSAFKALGHHRLGSLLARAPGCSPPPVTSCVQQSGSIWLRLLYFFRCRRDKLLRTAVTPSLTSWIEDTQYARMGDCISGKLDCNTETPVLDLFLFSLYMPDLKNKNNSNTSLSPVWTKGEDIELP